MSPLAHRIWRTKNFSILFKQSIHSVLLLHPFPGCLLAVLSQFSHISQLHNNGIVYIVYNVPLCKIYDGIFHSQSLLTARSHSIDDGWQNFSLGISNTFVNDVWYIFLHHILLASSQFHSHFNFNSVYNQSALRFSII